VFGDPVDLSEDEARAFAERIRACAKDGTRAGEGQLAGVLASSAVSRAKKRAPVVVRPDEGRLYPMGPLHAVFKADGAETRGKYAISEWWLEPFTRGPGPHQHDEDDVFFVLEGTMRFFVGGAWIEAPKGSLVIAPAGTPHDFENRTAKRAGMLNVSVPGEFEPEMEGIAAWFRARSAADSRTANAPRSPRARPVRRPKRRRVRD
jgi:mannose-6-phosphate isomerase-like protein (cupin superfamily)